jgi:hypothetical protein
MPSRRLLLQIAGMGSSVAFGTGMWMAPNKSITLVRVSSRARRIGSRVPSVSAWRPQEALLVAKGSFLPFAASCNYKSPYRAGKPALASVRG